MLDRIEPKQPFPVAMYHGASRQHLRIEQRPPGQVTMEHPTVPVRPVHHRGHGKAIVFIFQRVILSLQWTRAGTSAHVCSPNQSKLHTCVPHLATIGDKAAPCPLDHVNRQFKGDEAERPLALRLHLCRDRGRLRLRRLRHHAYAPRIVGWRASRTAHAGFVLDALEQALHDPATPPSRRARASQRPRLPSMSR